MSRQAIEAREQAFLEAFNKGDAARVAQFYGPGARILPPNADLVVGSDAIERFFEGFAAMRTVLSFELLTVGAQGVPPRPHPTNVGEEGLHVVRAGQRPPYGRVTERARLHGAVEVAVAAVVERGAHACLEVRVGVDPSPLELGHPRFVAQPPGWRVRIELVEPHQV